MNTPRPDSRRRSVRPACLLLLAALVAAPVGAEETGTLAELITFTVRPGAEADFETFAARAAEAARQVAPDVSWRVHQGVDAEPPTYVVVLRPPKDPRRAAEWAAFAPASALERAFGPEEARRVLALRERAVTGRTQTRYVERPDLAPAAPAGGP